jgi:hypothetical protein
MPVQYCIDNELNPSRLRIFKDFSGICLGINEAIYRIKDGQLTCLDKNKHYLDTFRQRFFDSFTSQVLNHYGLKDLSFDFMVNFNDVTLFGNTSLSDIFKQIHKNNKSVDNQINELITNESKVFNDPIEMKIRRNALAIFLIDTYKEKLGNNKKFTFKHDDTQLDLYETPEFKKFIFGKISGININQKDTPTSVIYQPTQDDYDRGYSIRYFYKKINLTPIIIKETNQENYNLLINDPLYQVVLIKWTTVPENLNLTQFHY